MCFFILNLQELSPLATEWSQAMRYTVAGLAEFRYLYMTDGQWSGGALHQLTMRSVIGAADGICRWYIGR
jgi:hypothetical protein